MHCVELNGDLAAAWDGLDPFVAQHVDDAFAQRLAAQRKRLPVLG